jgi:hypothetical protein
MEELSAIEVIYLKITQEETTYENALKSNFGRSELRRIKERIEQYKKALKYVQVLFDKG